MNKESLVYIKEDNGGFTVAHTTFKPHTTYRCSPHSDGTYVVYGEPFSKEEFDNLFENAHERIMKHFELIGLTVNGKPISKKEFKEKAYEVKYGKATNSFWTYWFYINAKECMYRFSPSHIGGSKPVQTTNAYDSYIDLINGDMTMIDSEDIEFGNSGLAFGSFRTLSKRFYHGHTFERV